jgi:hypothetical protein
MAKNDDRKIVATRVSAETLRVLQVALVAEGAETMQELLRPVIEEYARKMEGQPEVRAIIESVEDYRARKAGVERLSPRPKRRSRPRGSAGESTT